MQEFKIDKQYANERLDKVLPELLEGISRSRVQRMIDDGMVLCNGIPAIKKKVLAEGDVLSLSTECTVRSDVALSPHPQEIPLSILYEDEWVLAVNKPAGLVVHPGNGVPDGTLVNALVFRGGAIAGGFSCERPGIVHRLDKDTSGVILVAKSDTAHTRLATAFAQREVQKEYLAFCINKPAELTGCIDLPLDRSRKEPLKRAVTPGGKAASTSYRMHLYHNGVAVLSFYPHTGRTHQIRVHCSVSGFPILGDTLYGGSKDRILKVNPAERPFAYSVFKCFNRHALHAQKITFPHPETGCPCSITAPLPDDFRSALLLFGEDSHVLM